MDIYDNLYQFAQNSTTGDFRQLEDSETLGMLRDEINNEINRFESLFNQEFSREFDITVGNSLSGSIKASVGFSEDGKKTFYMYLPKNLNRDEFRELVKSYVGHEAFHLCSGNFSGFRIFPPQGIRYFIFDDFFEGLSRETLEVVEASVLFDYTNQFGLNMDQSKSEILAEYFSLEDPQLKFAYHLAVEELNTSMGNSSVANHRTPYLIGATLRYLAEEETVVGWMKADSFHEELLSRKQEISQMFKSLLLNSRDMSRDFYNRIKGELF